MVVKGAISCTLLAMVAANDVTSMLQTVTQKEVKVTNNIDNREQHPDIPADCSTAMTLLEEDSNISSLISTSAPTRKQSWERWSLDTNKDAFLPGLMKATENMLTDVISGKEVDGKKILEKAIGIAGKGVQGALKGAPIAQAVTGVLFGLLGSLLGEDKDLSQDEFYKKIISEVKGLILKDRIFHELQNTLLDFKDEMRAEDLVRIDFPEQYPLALQHSKDLEIALKRQRRIFNWHCWTGDYDHEDCKEWEKNGAVVLGARFAHWHLQVLTEIAASYPSSKFKYIQQVRDEGRHYVNLLRHSWQTWKDETTAKLNSITRLDQTDHKCTTLRGADQFKNYHTCYVQSPRKDVPWSALSACPKSRACRRGLHENHWEQWHNAWTTCLANNKKKQTDYINSVKNNIDQLEGIQKKASR